MHLVLFKIWFSLFEIEEVYEQNGTAWMLPKLDNNE